MFRYLRSAIRFLAREDGPTAVEYAVMTALVIVACITVIQQVGGNASGKFDAVGNALSGSPIGSQYGLSGTGTYSSKGSGVNPDQVYDVKTDTMTDTYPDGRQTVTTNFLGRDTPQNAQDTANVLKNFYTYTP